MAAVGVVTPAVEAHPPVSEAQLVYPLVRGSIDESTYRKLERAHLLAAIMLRQSSTCSEMFTGLGGDGLELLATAVYSVASSSHAQRICARPAAAFTTVGSPVVHLCRGFADLTNLEAAEILIHEALHLAGMGEYPSSPEAMTPEQIHRRVKDRCGQPRPAAVDAMMTDALEAGAGARPTIGSPPR